jgi:hypothetical protein
LNSINMGRIGIKINGEYLDLFPGTMLELEENNPFLQLENEILGQYSLPFTVPTSEQNTKLLGFANILQARKSTEGIPAILYVDGVQHSRGTIKREVNAGNLNHPLAGSISLYYLFGVADFYKSVENIYLTDVDYGPDITKVMGAYDADGDNTFFAHITDVINAAPGAFDYAFFPVINTMGLGREETEPAILNHFYLQGSKAWAARYTKTTLDIVAEYANEFCPFPYLANVLQKVFSHVGWQCSGEVLEDPEFQAITIMHAKYIEWQSGSTPGTPITWNIKNHVPRIKVGTWLIGLKNRMGITFNFDYRKKVCTIKYRNSILQHRTRRDITHLVGSTYTSKVNATEKIYALKQSGGDELDLY